MNCLRIVNTEPKLHIRLKLVPQQRNLCFPDTERLRLPDNNPEKTTDKFSHPNILKILRILKIVLTKILKIKILKIILTKILLISFLT